MGASFGGRSRVLVTATLASAGAIVVAAACIPDLAVTKLPPTPPPPSCGNGVVDLDAGEQCDPGPGDAGVPGCTASCTIECDGGLIDHPSGNCYFTLGALTLTYVNATSDCDLAGGHIVTFASREELGAVATWYAQRADAAFWVGLRNEPSAGWVPVAELDEPGFTTQCTGCFAADDGRGNFPQPIDAGSPCLVVASSSASAPWERVPCALPYARRTVCERTPAGVLSRACDGGTCLDLRRTYGAKRYMYVASKLGPSDAAAFCAALPSGSLVMLDSREEREELWGELAKIDDNLKQIWIGLSRPDADGGDWRWDDGAPLDGGRPLPWGQQQPGASDAGTSRAYLERLAGVVDSQLARTVDRFGEGVPATLPFVCQFIGADPQ